jgi:hypothetical protein
MKKLAFLALTALITLSATLPSQAGNPKYPQDHSWDYGDHSGDAGGAGGGGGQ